jgi:uncharacterized membrane protein YgcG
MRLVLAAAALLGLAGATPANAEERIERYFSDVHVQRDGTLEVAETIDVNVENDAINHGIYRDFPTRYRGPHGTQVHVGFHFERATLDGSTERATVSTFGNGVRIKIGDADKMISVGAHEFVIRYTTTRQIGHFSDFDELYWNVTGNRWMFPIDLAEVQITLPKPVRFGQRSVYTGAEGSTGTAGEVSEEKPGVIRFRTTAALGPYEGLTVAAAFPKGVVAPPSSGSRLAAVVADYGPPLVGLLGLIALGTFYYYAWQRAGRDPRAGTVVPMFTPPDGLTAPAMRYVTKMSTDNRTFAAALVDMGVRGHIRMVEEDGGFFSSKKTRLERVGGPTGLPEEEEAALDCLCSPGEQIMMEQKNHESFSSAKNALSGILKTRYDGKLFVRNLGWAAAGLFLFVACLWLAAAAVVLATDGGEIWKIGVVLGSLAVCAMLWLAFHDSAVGKCLLSLVSIAALAIASSLAMPIIGEALNSGWWLPLIFPLLALPVVVSAFWWIAAPTPDGRKVLDHIAGFKQYLSITEGERLDRMTGAPVDTPQLFEKYLPYAIALGVENRWADRFAGVLAAASASGQSGPQGFAWYSGSSSPWTNTGSFVGTVGASLSSSLGAASTAPGSSGGGFSGGGGGGGGGGGW